MPRRFIKRYMPDEATIKEHPHLSKLGRFIHDPNLWHLNRNSVSLAFLVGMFCAFLPIPMQMVVAAALAILVRSNLPIAVGLVWITNPLTMPPIFYATYRVGMYLLGNPVEDAQFELTMEWFTRELSRIWWPLLLGSVVCGAVTAVASYFGVRYLWLWRVGRSWKKRSHRNRKRPDND
ncbi:DUF2062 domain-containing protein [Motiliproteus sediminis]|uniref:DUF2062 domain-containing protein n=1 Tax=Motiliproteus sediminis TaxID=1468178 RepID=UPI001AEFB257|nr:DUF2062 domain-containing protein [Motiliproteus sediminis]